MQRTYINNLTERGEEICHPHALEPKVIPGTKQYEEEKQRQEQIRLRN